MTLLETIKNDMITAMKEKDSFRLGVIRMAKGAIQLEEINKKKELTDSDVIDIISKQIKLRKDAINEFQKANRLDLVSQNEKEIEEEFSGLGYGAFKTAVGEKVVEKLKPVQEKYKELLENPKYLEEIYTRGAEKARELASKTLEEVKNKIGIL